MANVDCQCDTGVKDTNLDYLRAIAEASDGGRRCVLAFGDWNLTPEELEASGVLEGLGLEIVRPTDSTISCIAGLTTSLSRKGTGALYRLARSCEKYHAARTWASGPLWSQIRPAYGLTPFADHSPSTPLGPGMGEDLSPGQGTRLGQPD